MECETRTTAERNKKNFEVKNWKENNEGVNWTFQSTIEVPLSDEEKKLAFKYQEGVEKCLITCLFGGNSFMINISNISIYQKENECN